MNKKKIYGVSVLLLSSLLVNAAEDDFDVTSLDAHTHGEAALTLASEDNQAHIQFESPAVNLFGFEHKASSDSEIMLIQQVKERLASPENLFLFNGADCIVSQSHVDITGAIVAENHHDHAHEHHHDEHKSHDSHVDREPSHSEVLASYHFDCTDGGNLVSVSVRLFEHFSGIEKINANWVTESKQGAVILRARQTNILLK